MFRRNFLASLAAAAGSFSFVRSLAKAEAVPTNQPLPLLPVVDPGVAFGQPGDELDGFTPQVAFVLGVEWRMFWDQLDRNRDEFRELVHPANVDRFLRLAREENKRHAVIAAPGAHPWAAPYERDWRVIEVGPCPFRHRRS